MPSISPDLIEAALNKMPSFPERLNAAKTIKDRIKIMMDYHLVVEKISNSGKMCPSSENEKLGATFKHKTIMSQQTSKISKTFGGSEKPQKRGFFETIKDKIKRKRKNSLGK